MYEKPFNDFAPSSYHRNAANVESPSSKTFTGFTSGNTPRPFVAASVLPAIPASIASSASASANDPASIRGATANNTTTAERLSDNATPAANKLRIEVAESQVL